MAIRHAQPYSIGDAERAFDSAYARTNALRGDVARERAGAAMAGGNYEAGANALLMSGNLADGVRVRDLGERRQAATAQAEKARRDETLKFTEEAASRLAEIHRSGKDPAKTVAAFDQYFAPRFRELGEDEAEIAQLRNGLASDPDTTLMALGVGAAKEAGYELRTVGDEVLVFQNGQLRSRYRGAKTATLGPDTDLVEIPGTGGAVEGEGGVGSAPTQEAPSPASARTSPDVDAVWEAAKVQESGGRGDAVGPETRYGRAYGSTQMLPATAEAMARKLGIAWNPALMREASPRALEYQDRLGRAYFEEGLEKYGNVEDALRYYHGGPNQDIWGPKTEAHVRAVMARVQPYEVADAGGGTPAPSGARVIARGRPKQQERWVDLPGGGQRNTLTGKTEGVPKTSGRLSATVIKLQDDLLRDVGAASSVNTLIDKFAAQLDTGELNLGPVSNLAASARNFAGMSDRGSQSYASFRAALEKMRNDSLRLNKGVQTEGDAQRAWNELLENVNDEGVVVQRLAEIKALNEQAIALRSDLVNQAREDSGFEPMDVGRFRAQPLPASGGGALPEAARKALREGQVTTFGNGQRWTLRGGKPVRVN